MKKNKHLALGVNKGKYYYHLAALVESNLESKYIICSVDTLAWAKGRQKSHLLILIS
jgi:hypothetical protein